MRAHKLLFLIFLVFYLIAGLALLITGSVAHSHAKQYAEITGYSLMSGAGFIIALGVIILILCILGFIGAWKNHLNLLKAFIVSLGIILLLQLIAAIIAFTLRNKADERLRGQLLSSMINYRTDGNSRARTEWNRVQTTYECCGVDSWQDWKNHTDIGMPPKSCCKNNDCTAPPQYYDRGCYEAARSLFYRYSKALGGVTIFFFFIEIIGLALAVLLLRDLKNNYGSV
ncbi:unnamed protein product [Didymodactylos carnosus]|uniref:Tetraspanin n=1 Tax=Didymodactylos carnosus TaxID=1234261 RepID=A0A813U418_9BILA|nr:unnamed protein product [Didymodactylos carnosus]CAF1139587.1 unnamed protein product [Didymodactylos carnosus]CAF3604694.1 unnamed protein product [Didymodactylos carnosus]CAF3932952.1 unnamed protein product [Didymodactylos carnosus]